MEKLPIEIPRRKRVTNLGLFVNSLFVLSNIMVSRILLLYYCMFARLKRALILIFDGMAMLSLSIGTILLLLLYNIESLQILTLHG